MKVVEFIWYFFLLFDNLLVSCSELNLVEDYQKLTERSLLWGPYRPNAYFGVRPRIPHSLISGLFWFNSDNLENINRIRHYCDQSLDFQGFGWTKYDPRIGGEQIFKDNEFGIDITTNFVKNENGNWAVKVKGVPRPGFENKSTSIVFYTGLESESDEDMLVSVEGQPPNGFDKGETVKLIGISKDFGEFEVSINDGPSTNVHKKLNKRKILNPSIDPSKTHYVSLNAPNDNVWKAADIFNILIQNSIKELASQFPGSDINPDPNSLLSLRNVDGFEGNLHFVQKIFTGAFEFDIIFNIENSEKKYSFDKLGSEIESSLVQFDEKFDRKFQLQAPFKGDSKYEIFSKEIISNLLGGLGYYYGDHLVDRDSEFNEETYEKIELKGEFEGPYELFTASPSRTFFPRGFYWDEGFHLIPLLEYDLDLTLEILKSWFNLIDEDGWIAREQILGPEARSKVPKEFQVQSPKIANPPTLMLVFMNLLEKLKKEQFNQFGGIDEPKQIIESLNEFSENDIFNGESHLKHPQLLIDYVKKIYPKLQKHYEWFRKTQKGELEEFDRFPRARDEAYRWRGRTYTHCLPSGLDDYPRASIPDVGELNVDLISWIGIMTKSMREIAELIGFDQDAAKYKEIESNIKQNIEDIHWSEDDKSYCDVSVDENDEDIFICNKGYITLFPFLLKQIEPGHDSFKHIIELLSDPEELYTNYGIRSLSKANEFYKTGEDYWRSPIWYPINYLILESLQYYGQSFKEDEKLYQLANQTYSQTRLNLVNNAYKQWKKTGYVYEQYDDTNGKPRGAKHFTGWTALVATIMTMPETL
ncbi:hypothetical protein WICMUC_005737 [Wickerhamomyces mucosus]|uniref:Mannosyl-oligosaccharide glucosidase n=1 Tax=Wickerhamomyces mucosus TaxID=1378264 RepID=A0A9P8P372_9ASCO|nr:hypothetical protein WICMUC_005737 [Wickerhamomyces mucosus]